jgi:hypothetical protein
MSQIPNIKWDWGDTKVHPAIGYPSTWVGGTNDNTVFGMLKSFNPRIVTPKDVIHSINDYNQGFVSKPPEYYVDVTCSPYGDAYTMLVACLNGDRYFDVILAPVTDYAAEDVSEQLVGQPAAAWGPVLEVFNGCKITDLNERYALGTEPTVTFTCRALRFTLSINGANQTFGDGFSGRTKTDVILGLAEEEEVVVPPTV